MVDFVTLEAILLQVKKDTADRNAIADWNNKCLYAKKNICRQSRYQLSDLCYISEGTFVDDNDIEHLPPDVAELELGLYCYGDNLADIVINAVSQQPGIKAKGLLDALNYYSINDSFIDFAKLRERPKVWHIGIFPNFPASQLKRELDVRDADFLKRGCLLEYPSGSVLLESGNSEIVTLCDLISKNSEGALYLFVSLPSAKQKGYWSHTLYQKDLVSPIRNPEDKKLKQPRLIANTEAFSLVFGNKDPEIIQSYLQSDNFIVQRQKLWEEYMTRHHKQKGWKAPEAVPPYRVLPADQYSSDDYCQVFDFLRYLSFPIQGEIGIF